MRVRRWLATSLVAALAVLIGAGPSGTAFAGVEPPRDASGGDTNEAVAVNTEDGASVFRFAFSIRHVTDGVVDQENLALAYASCTDCQTVALAFQVVLVTGGADYVAPVNQAGAINDQCAECLTFASATQIVIGVDGPVKFTPEGVRRLVALRRRMKELEAQLPNLSASQLAREVSSAEAELIDILSTELVPAHDPSGGPDDEEPAVTGTSTTTIATPGGTTTTTTTFETATSTTPPATVAPTTVAPTTVAPDAGG